MGEGGGGGVGAVIGGREVWTFFNPEGDLYMVIYVSDGFGVWGKKVFFTLVGNWCIA